MNREPLLKLGASQEIEALLSDTDLAHKNQDNWLLSYLDVFVLIIMLVITLLAITDFNTATAKKPTKKTIANKPEKKNTEKPLTKIESKSSLPKTIKYKTQPGKFSEKITTVTSTEAVSATKKITQTPEILNERPSSILDAKEKIASKPNKPLSTETHKETNTWKEQLKNNLDHFELNQFVNIKVRKGYAQIEIQDNVLFDSAQAQLTEEGQILLEKLTGLLNQSDGVIFVEGHTDNQPIATTNFPSNWELGSARATSVLHFLITQGINSQRLRAVTYADTMPLADNTTIEGRRKNRRVNLLVKLPNYRNTKKSQKNLVQAR